MGKESSGGCWEHLESLVIEEAYFRIVCFTPPTHTHVTTDLSRASIIDISCSNPAVSWGKYTLSASTGLRAQL